MALVGEPRFVEDAVAASGKLHDVEVARVVDGVVGRLLDVSVRFELREPDALEPVLLLGGATVAYDGRASKKENWFERIGLAQLEPDGHIEQTSDDAVYDARYLDVVQLPGGGYRIYYEARLPDESHELRTELVP